MKIKEPFLLIFSLVWIAFCFLPKEFYSRCDGQPYDDLLFRRIGFAGIGGASLLLWYPYRSDCLEHPPLFPPCLRGGISPSRKITFRVGVAHHGSHHGIYRRQRLSGREKG